MREARLTLKSQRFRSEREADWRKLEKLLDYLEAGERHKLDDEDVIQLPVLYRSALSSLSMARSISLDTNLIAYLESLSTRAYFFVYGARSSLAERVASFFDRDWGAAVRALWRETLISAGLCLLGVVVAFLLTRQSDSWFYSFVPRALAGPRGPHSTTAELSHTLFAGSDDGLAFFASLLFTHNAQISLFAFALGFAFCLPTAYLMLYNGFALGAFLALFVGHGLGVAAGGWLLIHGVTELLAVTLAGAAGLHIGWAIAFPGQLSRADAARQAGLKAATVMAGVVVMLMVAGILEGFGRQLILATWARYAIAALSALFWAGYFYGRRSSP
jgi:uncharacterized membrane protein SpoIIM required for sporulation